MASKKRKEEVEKRVLSRREVEKMITETLQAEGVPEDIAKTLPDPKVFEHSTVRNVTDSEEKNAAIAARLKQVARATAEWKRVTHGLQALGYPHEVHPPDSARISTRFVTGDTLLQDKDLTPHYRPNHHLAYHFNDHNEGKFAGCFFPQADSATGGIEVQVGDCVTLFQDASVYIIFEMNGYYEKHASVPL